jgi:hypothetical protein
MILVPAAYWVLAAHSTEHAESAKTQDQAIGSFAIGGILLLLDGMTNPR